MGMLGWQDYAISDGSVIRRKVLRRRPAVVAVAWRPRLEWRHRVLRADGDRRAASRRYGRRVDGGRRRRIRRRPDREDHGVPHGRHRGRGDQGRAMSRRIRLRRRVRLPLALLRPGSRAGVRPRHRRLLRQHVGRHQRHRARASRQARAHRDLRHRIRRKLGPVAAGAARRAAPAQQVRADGRLPRLRLRASLAGSRRPPRRVDPQRHICGTAKRYSTGSSRRPARSQASIAERISASG